MNNGINYGELLGLISLDTEDKEIKALQSKAIKLMDRCFDMAHQGLDQVEKQMKEMETE